MNGGIASLRCGDCIHFENGKCLLVKVDATVGDTCGKFSPMLGEGNLTASQGMTQVLREKAVEIPMYITRVSTDPQTGVRRWFATASGTKEDLYNERMSVELFRDFIQRVERREPVPEVFASKAWKGGLPYLSVAHYLDLEGFGIAGMAEQIWVDGQIFKGRGQFADTDIGHASFAAVAGDIEQNVPKNERVRISIAFVDWGHDHGDKSFVRKDLSERCEHCEKGVADKVYRRGQLVHLALTRKPAYIETSIGLEERSAMTSRHEDASTIVGAEIADELEKRRANLTQRSEESIDPSAIVLKQEEAVTPSEPEVVVTGTVAETVEEKPEEKTYLGGAMTLDAAEAFLGTQPEMLLDSWGVLAGVLTNVAGVDKKAAVDKALLDFQGKIDVMAMKAIMDVAEKMKTPVAPEASPSPRPAPHFLDEAIGVLKSTFDEALAQPLERTARLQMVQSPVNELAEVILRAIDQAQPEQKEPELTSDAQKIEAAVQRAVAPLVAKVAQMEAALASAPAPASRQTSPGVSVRRAIQAGSRPAAAAQPAGKPGSLHSLIRRTVGLGD